MIPMISQITRMTEPSLMFASTFLLCCHGRSYGSARGGRWLRQAGPDGRSRSESLIATSADVDYPRGTGETSSRVMRNPHKLEAKLVACLCVAHRDNFSGAPSAGAAYHGSGDAACLLSCELSCEVAVVVVSEEHFPATRSGRTTVVTAAGEIDLTNAEGLRDALLSALNAGALGLVVDMTATTFIDSAGVTALVRASRRARDSGATVRLAVAAPSILRVLNLVGIDQLIKVRPSVAEALASLPPQLTVIDSSTHTPSGPDATET